MSDDVVQARVVPSVRIVAERGMAGTWFLVLLIGAGAWFFRRQGDPWPWVIAKIAGIVAASVMTVFHRRAPGLARVSPEVRESTAGSNISERAVKQQVLAEWGRQ